MMEVARGKKRAAPDGGSIGSWRARKQIPRARTALGMTRLVECDGIFISLRLTPKNDFKL
jgi:hypothetical protein